MARCAAGEMQDVRLTCPSRAAWHLTLRRQHGRGLEQPNDGPACPPLAWVPPSLAEDFMGSRGSITEGSAKLQQYPCRRFTPWQKNAKTYPEQKLAPPKLFSHAPGRRRINAVRCTSPTWGIREGPASGAAHRKRSFSDLQTASTRADCKQSTSPAPTGPRWCQASHPHLQQQITTMSVERRVASDRRSGKDRRETEAGPPTNFERRRTVEARQPELTELHLSEDELKALGFAPGKSAPQK